MKIAIVGTGYVGLVSGACFAEMGTDVTCVDIDKAKIESLRQGIIPIYEPGLDELVRRNVRDGRLHFTTSLEEVINDVEAVFSAVGTPPDDDGSADLTAVKAVARTFGRHIDRQAILVTKSTVPVGTSEIIRGIINEELDRRGVNVDFELASNPEFLKEGAAIKDFMSPDRVVIGVDGPRSREVMERLYRPFLLQNFRVMFMDIPSAEMAKYAANAMLATRISFINDIANLCELTGADVSQVRRAIGADTRIGNKFLYPGCGYGGSCFPKDVQALIRTGEQLGYPMRVIQAVEAVNDEQKHIPFRKLRKALGRLEGRRIALWTCLQARNRRHAPGSVTDTHRRPSRRWSHSMRLRPGGDGRMPPPSVGQGGLRYRHVCRLHRRRRTVRADRVETVPPAIMACGGTADEWRNGH